MTSSDKINMKVVVLGFRVNDCSESQLLINLTGLVWTFSEINKDKLRPSLCSEMQRRIWSL